MVFVANQDTGSRRAVLPLEVEMVRTLLIGLDEGSIGMAGVAAAAFQQKAAVWARFDKIHRIIRDLKLASAHCCGKVFEKTKLWSSYIYGLNNRPFGSGSNHTLKEGLLKLFADVESPTSENFLKFVTRIGKDLDMPSRSPEDHQQIFNAVLEMKSFTQKLGQPKVSNWFAWNAMAKVQIPEFNGTKCVFSSVYTDEEDPDLDGPFDRPTSDPRAQLQAILKSGGGLALAHRLMKSELQQHTKILYVMEQPAWTWYTHEIENNKTPLHGVRYSLKLADDGWKAEPHLWETLATLYDTDKLRFMDIPMGESDWATKALSLSWHIVARRAWSLSKHSTPPESQAGLLASDLERRRRTAAALRESHRNFLLLERRAVTFDDAAVLRRDIIFLDAVAVRLVFEFYCRDRYDPDSKSGCDALKALLWTLPDNKIVEDIHQPLRLNARANVNRRLSFRNIQSTIMESGVLEKRNIPHHCKVNKQCWVRNFFQTSFPTKTRRRHESFRHKLKAPWSRMMLPQKTWHTLSEDTLQRAGAAWAWLHAVVDMRGRGISPSLADARMSKLVPPCVVLRRHSSVQ